MKVFQPNCSEATLRVDVSNLTKEEKLKLNAIFTFLDKIKDKEGDDAVDWWYSTDYFFNEDIEGSCFIIKGETPYNYSEELESFICEKAGISPDKIKYFNEGEYDDNENNGGE